MSSGISGGVPSDDSGDTYAHRQNQVDRAILAVRELRPALQEMVATAQALAEALDRYAAEIDR